MLQELGVDSAKKQVDDFTEREGDVMELIAEGVWDIHGHYEQMEAINYAVKSSFELAFEKVLICYYGRIVLVL